MADDADRSHRPTEAMDGEAMALFFESFDQADEEREAWLQARCVDRPDLFRRVMALVRADQDSEGFLESTPISPSPSRIGQRLGAYELVSEIASGGMSTVYRARRVDGTYQHDVAIKLFRAFHMDASARQRFDTERQILAALEHPNIARIIDGGTAEDGTPFVVMELVDGAPITQYCERHRVDLVQRLKLFIKVCQALAFAHRRGIIHRDIKPANVLVGAGGEPKLIDFGIAKVLQPETMNLELPETRLDQRPLTPEYASPEQLMGRPVGLPTDVYSMGVLLYELLTGQRPHQIAALSPAEAERVVLGTIPADPSQAIARGRQAPPSGLGESGTLRRRLRGDLDRIVMTAMRREPEARFDTITALAEDLERHLSGQPVRARGASRWYRASKFIARHRIGVAATALVFVVLVGSLAAVLNQSREARQQRDQAEAAKQFLVDMIGRADPYENTESATLVGAIKQSLPDIETRFAAQPELEAEMRYALGYALQNLGEIPLAREQLERAADLRSGGGDSLARSQVEDALGIVAWWESDFELGSRHFQQALDLIADDRSPMAEARRVTILTNWAGMLIDAGDFERSRALGERALARVAEVPIDAGTLATLWSNLATAREGMDDGEAALEAFEQALAVQRAETGENHPNYAIILNNLALLYYHLDRLDEGVEALEASVRIRLATLGDQHPQTATAMVNLARMLTLAGRPAEAEPHALRGLQVARAGWEPGHPRIGKAHEALALLYRDTGQLEQAREHAARALETYQAAPSVDPAWVETIQALQAELAAASNG
ncbi:protein kinase domain-containing protein [Wenzhouxiangella marina]|uniref:Protein kinase domain-containing protein n=1 Tax=Wenzhouxiangella marina TaxID=1579979 RepID=A0A0K0XZB2_9GAMM|nr:tetratricopeptide repeat protein [Wenzhouxiangella marina]AKS42972.1 hypothetical protein WM2015_2614 [Wenzhouxiangella marina]MBB6087344.1 serine/threonine-protein kinase [Wenzhouxiangella marina]